MRTTITTWFLVAALAVPAVLQAQQDARKVGEGAQVYAQNCSRCHNARSGTERSDGDWVPIIAHMRARANLSKSQAEAVLAFLQATNLPEGSPTAALPERTRATEPLVVPAELAASLAQFLQRPGVSSIREPESTRTPPRSGSGRP